MNKEENKWIMGWTKKGKEDISVWINKWMGKQMDE